jgi:hypothetical protein
LSARGPDLISDSACGRLVEIRRDDLHAFLPKAEGCGTADVPRRRSGNDGYLVPKSPSSSCPRFRCVLDQRAAEGLRVLDVHWGREIHSSPRRKLDRLPACYFVCERNSVVRIRT